jgi:hypothetical protein
MLYSSLSVNLPLVLPLPLQASPFIEVQAPRGGRACTAADLEHAHGKAAAWAPGPIKLERAGSHLVIKVLLARSSLIIHE